jgi:DNA-binding SARP family transcriptional activator
MVSVELRLFGPPRAFNSELGVETRFPGRTGQLLAYLALFHQRAHSRGRLAGIFWGEQREESARRCLSTALWRVRERLARVLPDPEELLVSDRFQVAFRPGRRIRVDVHLFEEAVGTFAHGTPLSTLAEAQEVERGLALYKAELLDGYFDDWVLRERERLRWLRLNGLAALVHFHRERDDVPKAIDLAQELLRYDPAQEIVLREIMILHVRAGQRALALEQYRTTARALARELDTEPMEETVDLYERIREGRYEHLPALPPDGAQGQRLWRLRRAAMDPEAPRTRTGRKLRKTKRDNVVDRE